MKTKRLYQRPTTYVEALHLSNRLMIASEEMPVYTEEETESTDIQYSRGFSMWDDEE